MKPTEQLQRIIRDCGMSRAEIARKTGVAEAVLSNFKSGKRGITTDTIDKLAPVLGLTITGNPKPPHKGK